MSSRSNLRRKMVLAVMVSSHEGRETQLAHTLDLTEGSARLGGLVSPLEPGEIIEVQHGAAKGKFRVIWMGSPGGALAHQAGIRSLELKSIWNKDLPPDEADLAVDIERLRQPDQDLQNAAIAKNERRWHPRYSCAGSASVKTTGVAFAIRGEVKDISKGGIYVEVSAPLPVNSNAHLDLLIEGVRFQATGVVRTSYPLLGMGIGFQTVTPQNEEKLALVVGRAKQKSDREQAALQLPDALESPSVEPADALALHETGLNLEDQCAPVLLLMRISRTLVKDFDRWKNACSPAQMEELRSAIDQLQQKLYASPENGFMNHAAGPATKRSPTLI